MVFFNYFPRILHVWILKILQVSSATNWCLNLISVSKNQTLCLKKNYRKMGCWSQCALGKSTFLKKQDGLSQFPAWGGRLTSTRAMVSPEAIFFLPEHLGQNSHVKTFRLIVPQGSVGTHTHQTQLDEHQGSIKEPTRTAKCK